MAISKTQPMREAEIELVDTLNQTNQDLTDEITRAQAAESTNADAIASEITRAQAAEGTISLAVSTNAGDITALERADEQFDVRLTLVENNMEHFPVVEWGNDSKDVPADSSATGSVTFDNEKQGIPLVIACIETLDTSASSTGTFIEIYDVTVTGFAYKVTNPDVNDSVSIGINWLAIGA